MQPETHTTNPETTVTEQWAILEIMGHERLAGKVSTALVAGAQLVQVDVPASEQLPAFTRLLSPTALFSLTPVPEAVARVVAGNLQKTAVSGIPAYGYTLAQQTTMRQALGLPAPAPAPARSYDEEEEHDGNYDRPY
ncbi:hypothetical protein GCM10023185_29900 [Hymenobacter saemangeumensis]|uniref:Uncharacterized protein n=1 Tax=Hymenobacter saemangeumensis TaxID=1084522 RepID=A0ABP8IL95_9BACT